MADETPPCTRSDPPAFIYLIVVLLLGAVMTATTLLCLAITPTWPLLASCALFFVLGTTASGWNGAFLAEMVRQSPQQAVSAATGGSLFVVNVGKFIGPIVFTAAYQLSGSYASAFALMAIPSAAGLVCMLLVGKRAVPGAMLTDEAGPLRRG